MSTPSSLHASTMSWPLVQSAVAEPCQVSPPSSSSVRPGRLARSFFTSVARCAKPPTLPYWRADFLEVEVREGMCLDRVRRDLEVLKQRLADDMRRLAARSADADVDVRFAEIGWYQLRVAVGEVQQRDVAERRNLVQVRGRGGVRCVGHPGRCRPPAMASICRNSRRDTLMV